MARKPDELAPIMARIPEQLRHRLEREATRNNRSMNSEIIHRLEDSFRVLNREIIEVLFEVAAATTEPKWIADGKYHWFRPVVKKLMKLRINDFIDSLPEPKNQRREMSEQERADFVREMNEKIANRG